MNPYVVELSYKNAMVTRHCRESPFGSEDVFSPVLWEWLDDRDPTWDFEIYRFLTVRVFFNDRRAAIHFKLVFT